MRGFRFLCVCLVLAALPPCAQARFFFKKQPKPNPAERVPELIVTLKTEQDEHKRAAAATELRQYDPKAFPEIVPILIDVLKSDPKTSVRLEAASSLSNIRPVSQEAGMALEYAAAKDPALRVRVQAKTSLFSYRLHGYHSPKKNPANKPNGDSQEPPLASEEESARTAKMLPSPQSPGANPARPIRPTAGDSDGFATQQLPERTMARPLPPGPVKSPLVPAEPPKLEKPPAQPEEQEEQGPELTPPE
jgi:hypothetical protein